MTTDLMPTWAGYRSPRHYAVDGDGYLLPLPDRNVTRIRRALMARGYQTPAWFRQDGPSPGYPDDDDTPDAPAFVWCWQVPYCRPGEYVLDQWGEPDTGEMPLLRGPSVGDIIDQIERLP